MVTEDAPSASRPDESPLAERPWVIDIGDPTMRELVVVRYAGVYACSLEDAAKQIDFALRDPASGAQRDQLVKWCHRLTPVVKRIRRAVLGQALAFVDGGK